MTSLQSQLPQELQAFSAEEIALLKEMVQAGVRTPSAMLEAVKTAQLGVVEHGETTFYIPETGMPIRYQYFQKIILNIAAGTHSYPNLLPFYSTIEYSTIKKSGKTALSGAYAKWRAESQTLNDEILFFANDETQSRGRAYAAIQKAIELNPLYDRVKRVLRDTAGNIVWRIIEDYLEHVPTQTKVRAVNVDYRGEAGANPTLTVWTEAWGYDSQKQIDLWDEMTPVLTREKSQRYVEGYAGYTGKSKVLEKVENLVQKEGRQLTLDDIPDWPWPDEELLPMWVNDQAGVFAYIDRGDIARRRMPWLQGPEADAYYSEQQLTLSPEQYERLHRNYWVNPLTAFVPPEWWDRCADSTLEELRPWREPVFIKEPPDSEATSEEMAAYTTPDNWRIVGPATEVVLAVDASISSDCTALVGCTRNGRPEKHQDVVLQFAYKWDPPKWGKIDFDTTPNKVTGLSLRQTILKLCMEYNVVNLSFDQWQLEHLMNELSRQGLVWVQAFSQSRPRDIADKRLYDLIRSKGITYKPGSGSICDKDIREHIVNAATTQRPKEDTKLHIIKAGEGKIDLVVALSMAADKTVRLDL